MRATRVLVIENERINGISFAEALQRKYQVHVARSGKQGLLMARSVRPDVIVLDAASLRTSGNRICARLRAGLGDLPIIHIRPGDANDLESPADVVLAPPFTSRKLINRIERFVTAGGELLEAGPFCLNLEQQSLISPWKETKLTPKLVALMEIFMRNPNQTIERKMLMQKIWQTDYMGDTRTLDVHIRWIREVVEPNPRRPRYIKTVRGIGYCFAPDPQEETAETAAETT
jgi:DNA-binding response OmpR family regulator